MHDHPNDIEIEAPVRRRLGADTDVEGWPAITPTMTSVERLDDGPLGVGSRALVKQPAQRATVSDRHAVRAEPPFEWEAKVFGVRMVGRHTITTIDSTPATPTTRNTLQIEMTGRGAGVLGRLSGGRIRKAIATENEGFRTRLRNPCAAERAVTRHGAVADTIQHAAVLRTSSPTMNGSNAGRTSSTNRACVSASRSPKHPTHGPDPRVK